MTPTSLVLIPPVPGWSPTRGTLSTPVSVSGRGLHTGRRSRVTLRPAEPGAGIRFQRLRRGRSLAEVTADVAHRYGQPMCTALRAEDGTVVRTVEHLLAACLTCGIDDAEVEIEGEELPIFDGSASPWTEAIIHAGVRDQGVRQRFLQILAPLEWSQGARCLRLEPRSVPGYGLSITMSLKNIGQWTWSGELTPEVFRSELAAARSFGRVKLAIPALLYGLIRGIPILRGAGPWCTAAIWGDRVIGGTRMPDEFVRHRAIDVIGDLALLGAPILGQATLLRPSHEANFGLLNLMRRSPEAWRWVEVDAGLAATRQERQADV
ncbi:MAG: UDP-3-O-acyl-N-acetylglucosamine deacetylase [Geobacter sp.]|nr:MAG: UDP-3-O-acyl-N-acetylglucosamine deacetylase [Geobacter sp.]